MSRLFRQATGFHITGATSTMTSPLHINFATPTLANSTIVIGVWTDGILGLGHSDQGLDGMLTSSVTDNINTPYVNQILQTSGWPQNNLWTACGAAAGITGVQVAFSSNLNTNYANVVIAELLKTDSVDASDFHSPINRIAPGPYNATVTTTQDGELFFGFFATQPNNLLLQSQPGLILEKYFALSSNGQTDGIGIYCGALDKAGSNTIGFQPTTQDGFSETFAWGMIAFKTSPPLSSSIFNFIVEP